MNDLVSAIEELGKRMDARMDDLKEDIRDLKEALISHIRECHVDMRMHDRQISNIRGQNKVISLVLGGNVIISAILAWVVTK